MTKARVPISSELVADVIFASDSTCCVCRERGKAVQVHHVNEDPSHNTFENLALLCLECHNQTQVNGGFGRKLNAALVIKYRNEWLERVVRRRDAADRIAIEKVVGLASLQSTPMSKAESIDKISYSQERADAILSYVHSLPDLRLECNR